MKSIFAAKTTAAITPANAQRSSPVVSPEAAHPVQRLVDASPQVASLMALQCLANSPVHRVSGKEEPLQRRFALTQRQVEEEGPLQGKFGDPAQAQLNRTGLPDNIKGGVENLAGRSMDNVRVHYNSGKPAQLNALAYAQGTDIHLGPGQEKHLPHEARHVVQQEEASDSHSLIPKPVSGAVSQLYKGKRRGEFGFVCACEAQIITKSKSYRGNGGNNGQEASNILDILSRHGLTMLGRGNYQKTNPPGGCAEPHAVADAIEKKPQNEKVKGIKITDAKNADDSIRPRCETCMEWVPGNTVKGDFLR